MTLAKTIRNATLAVLICTSVQAADSTSTELVSRPANPQPRSFGDSGDHQLSADGKWLVFTSTGNGLLTNDNNGFNLDVFLRNNETGETALLSRNKSTGISGNGHSFTPLITPDGRRVIFQSDAGNLSTSDTNEATDFYIFTRSGDTGVDGELMFLTSANGVSLADSVVSGVSTDGNTLLIETIAGISPQDTNDSVDLYRLHLLTEQLDLVSAKSNSLAPANVAFASDIVGSFEPSMSADGRFIAFISSGTDHAPGLPANAAPQLYVRDMVGQTNAWLTRATGGISTAASAVASPVVSTNGDFVLFLSSALGTISPVPATSDMFLYRYDIATGQRTRIGGTPSIHAVSDFSLSDDGQYVALASSNQIYLHHLATGTNFLVSRTADGAAASGISADPLISADGRIVVFTSTATNLVDGVSGELFQAYRFDRETGEIALLSRAAGSTVAGANNDILFPELSADGSTVAFMSYASNLTTNDNPLSNDLFLVSSSGTGAVTLASAPHPLSISATPAGQSYVEAQAISLDGRYVVFSSDAPDVVQNDTNTARDIFLRDLQNGTTSLISRQPDASQHTSFSTFISASLDGNIILYSANQLVEGVSKRILYLYNRSTGSNTVASVLPNGTVPAAISQSLLSPDGRFVIFRELTALTSPLYIYDVSAGATTQYIPTPSTVGTEPIAISPSGDYLLTRQSSINYALHNLEERRYETNVTINSLIGQTFAANNAYMLIGAGILQDASVTLRALDPSMPDIIVATNASPVAYSIDGSTVAYSQREGTNQFLYFYDVSADTYSTLEVDGTNAPVRLRASTFSADGRYFAFVTSTSLTDVGHDFNKLYVYDTVLKSLRLAAVNDSDEAAEFGVGNPAFSGNGRVIVYDTFSSNLVTNDLNLSSDVFVSRLAAVDSDTDGLEDGWESIHFDGLTISGDADSDNDGISNRDEFRAGTDPNNASSNLSLEMQASGEVMEITAPASPGITYQLEHRSNLSNGGWQPVGLPAIALSNTIAFEAPLELEGTGFFRISAVH